MKTLAAISDSYIEAIINTNSTRNDLIFITNAQEIEALPADLSGQDLCITYILEPNSGQDLDLFTWLFKSGIEFKRTAAGKYRFILMGAQVPGLIQQVNFN